MFELRICPVFNCIEKFNNYQFLFHHVNTHHKGYDGVFFCDCAGKAYGSKSDWKRHVVQKHCSTTAVSDESPPPPLFTPLFSLPSASDMGCPSDDECCEQPVLQEPEPLQPPIMDQLQAIVHALMLALLLKHNIFPDVYELINAKIEALLLVFSQCFPDVSPTQISEMMAPFQTDSSRERFLQTNSVYTQPRKYRLFTDLIPSRDDTGATHFVEKERFFYAIDVEYVISNMLNHPDLQTHLITQPSRSGVFKSAMDGNRCRSLQDKYADPILPIGLYMDGVAPGNHCSPKSGPNGLTMIYLTILALPSFLRSTTKHVYFLGCAYTADLVHTKYVPFLTWFKNSMNQLTKTGVTVEFRRKPVRFRPVFFGILGDKKQVHEVCGFKAGFSRGFICSSCLIPFDLILKYVDLQALPKLTIAIYNLLVTSKKTKNVKFVSALNGILHYHVVYNCYEDLMHCLDEGWGRYMITYTVRTVVGAGFISFDQLNQRIVEFRLGRTDNANQPSELPANILKSRTAVGQRASQCHSLLRFLPHILHDVVPSDYPPYKLFCDYVRLVQTMCLPCYTEDDVALIQNGVRDHILNFKVVYGANLDEYTSDEEVDDEQSTSTHEIDDEQSTSTHETVLNSNENYPEDDEVDDCEIVETTTNVETEIPNDSFFEVGVDTGSAVSSDTTLLENTTGNSYLSDATAVPKLHAHVHFGNTIRQLGALSSITCYAFESKNAIAKRITYSSRNFINLPVTISKKMLKQFAADYAQVYVETVPGKVNMELISSHGGLNTVTKALTYRGTCYKVGDVVVFDTTINYEPIFAKINHIILRENRWQLIARVYKTHEYVEAACAYQVYETDTFISRHPQELNSYHPLDMYSTSLGLTIVLRHRPCDPVSFYFQCFCF